MVCAQTHRPQPVLQFCLVRTGTLTHTHTHMFCGVRTCHCHHIKWKGRGSSARARFPGPLLHAVWRDTFKVKRRKLSEVQRAQAGR